MQSSVGKKVQYRGLVGGVERWNHGGKQGTDERDQEAKRRQIQGQNFVPNQNATAI